MTNYPEVTNMSDDEMNTELSAIIGEMVGEKFTESDKDADRLEAWVREKGVRVTWYYGRAYDNRQTYTVSLRLNSPALPSLLFGTETTGFGFTMGRALGEAVISIRRAIHPDLFRAFQRSKR